MDTIIPQDDIPRKQCKVCKEWLPATKAYFHASNTGKHKDRLKPECKKCRGKGINFGFDAKECKEGEKRCRKCLEVFPATTAYFHVARSNRDGLHTLCKKCNGKGTNFGIIQEPKEYRPREKQCIRCQEWLPKHEDFFGIDRRRKDGFNVYCKVCNEKDREKRHDAIDRQQKAYYHNNKEKRFAGIRNRNAIKRSVHGTHNAQDIEEQLKRQHYRCYYAACGFSKFPRVKVNGKWKYTFDIEHTFPLARIAGTDIPGNDISYIVLACASCNSKKGKKFPWEWVDGGRLL